ncbi:hypothetical protein [Cetobacterium sp.]|uniref:hypothetical protein n=1 Tax=Cetobacterium sp. TaxID=2071632 RepID=UPI003EE74DEF
MAVVLKRANDCVTGAAVMRVTVMMSSGIVELGVGDSGERVRARSCEGAVEQCVTSVQ